MDPVILADTVDARAAEIAAAATDAGLDDEAIERLVDAYLARAGTPAPRTIVCGNVRKAAPHHPCTKPPHPDEPGNREPHSYADPEGTVHTWIGPLTLAEQLEQESGPRCGHTCQCHGGLTCIRPRHGDDAPHAAWADYVPDPAAGPQGSDPDRMLVAWTCA